VVLGVAGLKMWVFVHSICGMTVCSTALGLQCAVCMEAGGLRSKLGRGECQRGGGGFIVVGATVSFVFCVATLGVLGYMHAH
jgi:hypothetical protein